MHTEGPWELVKLKRPLDDYTGGSYIIRAEIAPGGVAVTIGGVGEEESDNASLLAAAPKLLAACKEFVRKCDCGEARSVRSYKQMSEAIAEAERR